MPGNPTPGADDRWPVARLSALTVALILVQFVGAFSPEGGTWAPIGGALALVVGFLTVWPPPAALAPWVLRAIEATAWGLIILAEPPADERGMRIAAMSCAFAAFAPEPLPAAAMRWAAWTAGALALAWTGHLLPSEAVAVAAVGAIGTTTGLFGLEDRTARQAEAAARQDAMQQLSMLETSRESLERSKDRGAEQLVQQERLATLGRLAAGIAHEINNPLAIALTNLQLAERENDPSLIGDAQAALRRIRGIVSDLSRVARPEDATDHGQLDDVHLARMLDTVIELARVVIKGGARIRVETMPGVMVRGRRGRLEQVMLNLLVNAWQALEPTGRGTIRLSVEEGVDRVRLFVDDDGPGVPIGMRELVFEPFYTTKGAEGSGLGLAISRSYMRAMGGDLTCTESPLGGARFIVELLPVDDLTEVTGMASRELVFAQPEPPPMPERENVPSPTPGDDRPLLLVVDDEAALRRSLERSLRSRWRVVTTATTHEAFRICLTEHVEVVLCDLTLSEDDGLNLLRMFVADAPWLLSRTVLMSGEPSERQIELARRNRDHLVLKPFDLDVLEEQLRLAWSGERQPLWVPPPSGATPRPTEPRVMA